MTNAWWASSTDYICHYKCNMPVCCTVVPYFRLTLLHSDSSQLSNVWLLNLCHLTTVRFNSAVKYASDRHFRDQVYCAQVPTATSFSETVVAVQNCTWRSYKTEVHFEPRHRPIHFQSTAIVFPKHARNTYRTTLSYNGNKNGVGRRRFVSTVRLESTEDVSPCIIYTEDLWDLRELSYLSKNPKTPFA